MTGQRFGVPVADIHRVLAEQDTEIKCGLAIILNAVCKAGYPMELQDAVLKELTMVMVESAWARGGEMTLLQAADAATEIRIALRFKLPPGEEFNI